MEGEPSDLWRECTIVDVSTLGVGMNLRHPDPIELLGLWQDGALRLDASRRMTVHFETDASVETPVVAEIRNAGSSPDGFVRAGIEFVGLTETQRSLVDSPKVTA